MRRVRPNILIVEGEIFDAKAILCKSHVV